MNHIDSEKDDLRFCVKAAPCPEHVPWLWPKWYPAFHGEMLWAFSSHVFSGLPQFPFWLCLSLPWFITLSLHKAAQYSAVLRALESWLKLDSANGLWKQHSG